MLYRQWTPNEALTPSPRSVALGVFDGVHLGHRAVIAAARNVSPSPVAAAPLVTVLSLVGVPKEGGRLITADGEQAQAATLGVDEWLCVPFESICELSPAQFVREVLHEKLHATVVCCGYNFRFGKHGAGNAATLRELCEPLGMEVRVVPAVEREGRAISSTAVREAVSQGDMSQVMALLGRPYTVAFPVRVGNRLGSRWGFPTINQPFPEGFVCPKHGVYASLVVLNGVQHRAITNIGVHPTVGGTAAPQAETYIFDYEGDLYGQAPEIQLIRFLREECCFDTVEALQAQIADDITAAKALLDGDGGKAILFDFDDTLQHRPHAFLGVARELLNRYLPELTEDVREEYARWMQEENRGGYVDSEVYFKDVCEHCGFPVEAEVLLRELRCRFPFHSELLPHAVEVLCELKRRGYRLGIVTNGPALQQNLKLDHAGIRPYVDVVLVAGTEGVQKPQAEVFYRAAQRLCAAPKDTVFVGDYPPNDIVGAQNAGMTPLYIDVHGQNECPDGVEKITDLQQLLDRF